MPIILRPGAFFSFFRFLFYFSFFFFVSFFSFYSRSEILTLPVVTERFNFFPFYILGRVVVLVEIIAIHRMRTFFYDETKEKKIESMQGWTVTRLFTCC